VKQEELEELLQKVIKDCKWWDGESELDIRNGYDWEEWSPKDESPYKIKMLDQYGGEGQGDTIYYIFALYEDDELLTNFKVEGYYDSWNGSDWSYASLNIVAPKKVEVTSWVNVDTTEKSVNSYNEIIKSGKSI